MASDLDEATVLGLRHGYRAGEFTAREVVERYLQRIEAIDSAGPRLNSISALNDAAVAEADRLDQDLRSNSALVGPLHGVPVVLKDSIETAGIQTAYGSVAFVGHRPTADARLVQLLRAAGAIILAKTTMPDFATSWFGHSSATGETLNPYNPSHDPGGSSAGTGAAVAADLATVGVGADTGGSIRVPASFNGLVGLRPTTGLISRHGVAPLVSFEDTCGPMTRTVYDAALVMDALVGFDSADSFTGLADRARPEGGYAASLREGALEGRTVAVLRSAMDGSVASEAQAVLALVEASLLDLESAGALIVDLPVIPAFDELMQAATLYAQQCKRDLTEFLSGMPRSRPRSFDELWTSGRFHPLLDFFGVIASGPDDPASDPLYHRGFWAREELQRQVLRALAQVAADVVVYPTVLVPPPLKRDVKDGRWGTMNFPTNTALASHATLPALTMPIGLTPDGLPVGLEMLGRPLDDALLLTLAYDYERAFARRRPPWLAAE